MKGEADAPTGPQFRILGPLQVLVGGEERQVPGEKQQALLARLLLEPNRPVSADRLIDDLWGEHPPATARQSLHAHVTRLRRTLAADGDGSSPLANDGRGYFLHVDGEQIDAARFRGLLAVAREERRAGRRPAARRSPRWRSQRSPSPQPQRSWPATTGCGQPTSPPRCVPRPTASWRSTRLRTGSCP